MPGTCNFSVRAGDTFLRTITWKDSAGDLVNLTGYTAQMVVSDSDGSAVITLTGGSGITLGGSAGTIGLQAQTSGIDPGCYSYFLKLTSGTGIITTLLVGSFDITQ